MDLGILPPNVPKPVIFHLINFVFYSLAQSKLILIWKDDVYLIKLTKSKLDRDLLIINKDAKDKEILLKDRNSLWKPEVVITIQLKGMKSRIKLSPCLAIHHLGHTSHFSCTPDSPTDHVLDCSKSHIYCYSISMRCLY